MLSLSALRTASARSPAAVDCRKARALLNAAAALVVSARVSSSIACAACARASAPASATRASSSSPRRPCCPSSSRARVAEAGALARAQAAQAIDDETRALTTNAAATNNSARAFLQSTAAGERAEAVRKALSESIRNGVDVETRARQILLEQ